MKEILRFNYDNTDYVIAKENNVLKYGKKIDGRNDWNVTSEELQLMKDVFKEILPSNNMVTLGVFKFKDKYFINFGDKKTWLNLFYEVVDKKVIAPKEEDLVFLNNMFNHQSEFVYSNGIDNDSNREFFRRVIKKGQKLIVAFVAASTLFVPPVLKDFVTINQSNEVIIEASTYMETGSVQDLTDYSFLTNDYVNYYKGILSPTSGVASKNLSVEEITNAINNNSKLSTEEKELFLSHPDFFENRIKYLDHDTVINFLNNLEVHYYNEDGVYNGKSVAGLCDHNLHVISIYNSSNFMDAPKHVLTHEFCHVFQNLDNASFGNSIFEFLNTRVNDEYFGDGQNYDTGYAFLNKIGRALFEIIDNPDVLNTYHANPNPQYLINELMKIIPDEDKAIKLIYYFDKINHSSGFPEMEDCVNYFEDSLNELLIEYYEVKTQSKLEDNEIMYFCLKTDEFNEEIRIKNNLPQDYFINPIIVKDKNYVNINEYLDNSLVLKVPKEVEMYYDYYTEEELKSKYCDMDLSELENVQKMEDGRYQVKNYLESVTEDYYLNSYDKSLAR